MLQFLYIDVEQQVLHPIGFEDVEADTIDPEMWDVINLMLWSNRANPMEAIMHEHQLASKSHAELAELVHPAFVIHNNYMLFSHVAAQTIDDDSKAASFRFCPDHVVTLRGPTMLFAVDRGGPARKGNLSSIMRGLRDFELGFVLGNSEYSPVTFGQAGFTELIPAAQGAALSTHALSHSTFDEPAPSFSDALKRAFGFDRKGDQ